MSSLPHSTGQALDRVDGPAKVTGQARYAAEYPAADLLHGSVVSSDVARGRVRGIDCAAALAVPGVVAVLHHLNRPPMAGDDEPYKDADAAEGEPFRPLFDDRVLYSGQPLALVLARSLELARYAGSLLRIDIEPEPHQTDLLAALDQAHEAPAELPAERGDFYTAYRAAPIRVEASYSTPIEHHNPMEPHASTVIVQPDGSLLVHDKTQGTQNSQAYLQKVFGLPADKVRVCAAYVGGAFGSGLRPQYQLALAVMAALQLRRSVRVVLTRQQMFTFGYRPRTLQRLQLGADAEGRLLALGHQATAQTSRFEDFTEHVVEWSGMLYRCENLSLAYRLVPLDVYTPLDMRAPGAALGLIGLECAMDELAVRLGMDPIALRRFNFAERNGNEDKPYSSKALLACYEEGARRFGWQARDPRPRSMSEGRQLLGWGMAGGVWEAMQSKASARARLEADGLLRVASATTDIGTGTYTVMTQIAADAAGMKRCASSLATVRCPRLHCRAARSPSRRSVPPSAWPACACARPWSPMPGPAIRSWPAPPKNASAYAVAIWKRAIRDTPWPTCCKGCRKTRCRWRWKLNPRRGAKATPPRPIRRYSSRCGSTKPSVPCV